MGLIRNLLTVFGVIAVFGVFYLFIKPDWYEKLASNPASSSGSGPRVSAGTMAAVFQCDRGVIEKERLDKSPIGLNDVVEGFGQGVPPKNSPYLLIVDKSSNTMRYWKLSAAVKKIAMKNANSLSVLVKTPDTLTYAPAYQMEIWIDNPVNLNLEFEMGDGEK